MNMPKPMTQNNYDKIAAKILNVTKAVAEDTMSDAAKDIRENITPDYNCVDTGVSYDWTRQKKGFSSLNGVFTAISIDSARFRANESFL